MEEKKIRKIVNGYDCLCTCISNTEIFYGIDVKDEEVYFGMGPRTLFYDGNKELLYSNSHESIKEWLAINSIHLKEGIEGGAIEYIKNRLKVGCCLVLCVETGHLTYRDVYLQNTSVGHYIEIVDYDKINEKFFVIDGFIPNENAIEFVGWVDSKEIITAWKKAKFCHFLFEQSTFCDITNLTDCSRINCVTTIYNYLNSGFNNNIVTGEEAIRQFVDSLNEDSDFESKVNQMKILGFTTLKRYIFRFLQNHDELRGYDNAYMEIIEAWDAFCLMLFKIHITKRFNRLEKSKNFARELIEKEHEILSLIYKQIKKEAES